MASLKEIKRKSSVLFSALTKRASVTKRFSLAIPGVTSSKQQAAPETVTLDIGGDLLIVVAGPPKVGKTVFVHALRKDLQAAKAAIDNYEPTLEDTYKLNLKGEVNAIEVIDTGGSETWAFEEAIKSQGNLLIIFCVSAHDPTSIFLLEKNFTSKIKGNFNVSCMVVSLVHKKELPIIVQPEIVEEFCKQHLFDASFSANLDPMGAPQKAELALGDVIRKHKLKILQLQVMATATPEPASARGSRSSARGEIQKLFGESLDTILARQTEAGNVIPQLVDLMISYLETEAIKVEGPFRVSAVPSEVEAVKFSLDRGVIPDFKKESIHTVCSLFKLYIRELPECLIPSKKYDQFIQATQLPAAEQAPKIKELLQTLPKTPYNLLLRVIKLLNIVALHSDTTKLSGQSLSTIFGLTLMRSSKEAQTITIAQQIPHMNKCVEIMVSNFETVFS